MIVPMTDVHPAPTAKREPRELDYIVCDGKLVARISDVIRDPYTGELLALVITSDHVYKRVRHAINGMINHNKEFLCQP